MNPRPTIPDEHCGENAAPRPPAELLLRCSSLLPSGGCALDLACGRGRHSVFLAERGLRVVAVDRALTRLEEGRELARLRNLGVDWVCADLQKFALPVHTFDLIVCFYYRDPALYTPLRAALRPAGLIVYETFTREQLRVGFGPRNSAHLLEPAELLHAFGDWDVIFYRETQSERAVASLVARKPGHGVLPLRTTGVGYNRQELWPTSAGMKRLDTRHTD